MAKKFVGSFVILRGNGTELIKMSMCKGKKITNISEVVQQDFIYCRNKLYHKGWFMSWQMQYMMNLISLGVVYYAEGSEVEGLQESDKSKEGVDHNAK